MSEPEEEWEARNLLYSLRYDLATFIHYPRGNLRQRYEIQHLKIEVLCFYLDMCYCSVYDGMTELCKTYFPIDLKRAKEQLQDPNYRRSSINRNVVPGSDDDDEEEEEEAIHKTQF